ncbi:MAG: hypothetical protein Q9163_004470 [Psora crenata]
MRRVKVFSGSSHPLLVNAICERLGTSPAECDLWKFSNGEISVNINTSVRNQDVFIVQSGSAKINDSVMEMLVMISACKGGSAKSITGGSVVARGMSLTDWPSCYASKKKSHRGAITARLLANLLSIAGIHHVITVDLHAPPTQGFFGKPVDNLHAEPIIARWIKANVVGWKDAVVVSKNSGGTKRVTSLADALKLNFALVTTDRLRMNNMQGSIEGSSFFDRYGEPGLSARTSYDGGNDSSSNGHMVEPRAPHRQSPRIPPQINGTHPTSHPRNINIPIGSSPLVHSTRLESASPPTTRRPAPRETEINRSAGTTSSQEEHIDEYTDERAREVITGRLIHGHIVDDDAPSPSLSAMSGSISGMQPRDGLTSPMIEETDPLAMSSVSTMSRRTTDHIDPGNVSDEEEGFKDPELEHTVTLVGNVQDRVVLIIDDMIDQCGSWIAAAETVVKRGDAKKVYCIATHGLFGDDSLEQMEACECIDHIVVTNTYPIAQHRLQRCKKLVILDMSHLLSEAIRRNHYGESISALFQHYSD